MEDLSYLTLQLLRLCKRWQKESLALNTALSAILHEDAEVRAVLTPARMQDMVASAEEAANLIVDREFAEVEEALVHGSDVRSALRLYLEKHQ